MPQHEQHTLFALDCGATNWRLYRSIYLFEGGTAALIGEPQISSLTSFTNRKLPAAIELSPEGDRIVNFGENAQQQLEKQESRAQVREFFKPCIGQHLIESPQSHQTKFTHQEALFFTELMLSMVLDQIKAEKWRAGEFDSQVLFSFAYPVHWRSEHDGAVFRDFQQMVLSCFPEAIHQQIRFVAEPEGAILSLHRQGLIQDLGSEAVTLIIDIGGSTMDIVAGHAKSNRGELNFIGRHGAAFGGGSYDTVIADVIAAQLNMPPAVLEQPYILSSLRSFAQRLKESLSRQKLSSAYGGTPPQRMISIVDDHNKVYRQLIHLDETRFSEITQDLHRQFETILEDAMIKIGISTNDVGQVILVGGGSQLFSIVEHLRDLFGTEKVLLADNPDEIVVHGVGLEYGKEFEEYQPTFYFTPEKIASMPEERLPVKQFMLKGEEASFNLSIGNSYKIGRDRANDIHLNKEKISRFHAQISVAADGCILEENGSTNGTFVNGERIRKGDQVTLTEGDQIQFGDQEFLWCEQAS